MTLFGKFLVFIFVSLLGGAGWLVIRNYDTPRAEVEQRVEPKPVFITEIIPETPPESRAEPEPFPVSVSAPVTVPVPVPPLSSTHYPLPTTLSSLPDWNTINTRTRAALANILCTAKNGDLFQPLSGSGVFIDSRGVILTNAHVAQYLLLTSGGEKSDLLNCVIRIGNPAEVRYHTELLFISPQWVAEHAKNILEESPKSRGENDYALLLVTGTTNPAASPPDSFPTLSLRTEILPDQADAYLVAGYPAGFLGGIAVQLQLWSTSSFATIAKRYTFSESTLDLVGLGGNVLAQKGASGGALVDGEGKLAGLIVTATVEGTTDTRDVRALTIDYVTRAFEREAGFPLADLADANLPMLRAQFARDILPSLRQKLVEVLE
jgi:hypothetical protein